ncbi:MAG: site-2 protease family protein, partial [Anaerolineae bacterium]|nr:site-2 protease family protein [Anaerolineae bacterium]
MTLANTMGFGWTISDDPALLLRAELADVLAVNQVTTSRTQDGAVRFVGHLLQDAESAFGVLEQRFRRLGYTPLLRREGGEDVVLALHGVVRPTASNPLVNLALFVLTVASTIFAGAFFTNPIPGLTRLEAGVLFSASILLILGTHEFGHYFLARLHKVAVTLPYFIPFPLGAIGTFGAFIRMKSPVQNRKSLFDVAVAGPLAGLVVAIPVLVIGLLLSPIVPRFGGRGLEGSLLVDALIALVRPRPAGMAILLHPIAWAGYIGLLVTGINLLPAGQLDGGHTAYAVFGRYARWLGGLTVLAIGALAILTREPGWYLWLFFILATGMTHAQPLNDITPLGTSRK